MKADEIDAAMSAMSDRLNHVGVGADASVVSRLNALMSDWQDFYWGEYEQWPVTQLAVWENNLPNMEAALTRLEQSAGTQSEPVTSAPSSGPIIQAPELRVVGTWPLWMKVTAGSVIALALYKVLRKTKLL